MSVCLSVCPAIDSAPGHDRDIRPISLEPVGLRPAKKIFPKSDQWPNYRTNKYAIYTFQ